MCRRLGRMGLQVDRAEDGRAALEMIKRAGYDLILTDIYMPGATGLDIIRLAKENDPHVQVVVVTGSATLDNAVEALNMGAFSYLTKPFDHLSVFDNAVSRALEFRHLALDNLRMAEIQRRRGGLLEDEVTERVRLLRTRQPELQDLLACLPDGVVILEEGGLRRQLDPGGPCGSVDGVRPWRDHDPVRVLPGHYLHVRTGRAPEARHRSSRRGLKTQLPTGMAPAPVRGAAVS